MRQVAWSRIHGRQSGGISSNPVCREYDWRQYDWRRGALQRSPARLSAAAPRYNWIMKGSQLTALWIKRLCSILWLSGFAVDGQVSKPESFYAGAQHTIIQLRYLDGSTLHTATGFFVKKGGTLYVVTAGHVARDSFSYTAIVRYLASRSDGTLTSIDARLTMPHENWVLHPQEGDATHSPVDVAAMKITNHGGIRVFWYCPSDCPDQKGILFAKEDAEPPMPVLVFGFPLNEPGLRLLRSVPLGRQGIIGLVDTTEDEIQVDGKYFDRLGFIIDIPTLIGGSSGSPVLSNAPLSRQSLVGLISGATDRGDPGAYARAGGYAVAEPVSRIEEVLNSPRIEKMPAVDTWCLLSAPDAKKFKPSPPFPVCQ